MPTLVLTQQHLVVDWENFCSYKWNYNLEYQPNISVLPDPCVTWQFSNSNHSLIHIDVENHLK